MAITRPFEAIDPAGNMSGTSRVLRDGSWFSRPRYCRAAFRSCGTPNSRDSYVGFRVCRDV